MNLLSAVIGGLVTAVASYLALKNMFERQRFENAASQFRFRVANVFIGIYPSDMGDLLHPDSEMNEIIGILEDKWPELLKAYSEFNYYVKDKESFRRQMVTLLKFSKEHIKNTTIREFLNTKSEKFDEKVEKVLSFSEWENNCCSRTSLVCNFIKNFLKC